MRSIVAEQVGRRAAALLMLAGVLALAGHAPILPPAAAHGLLLLACVPLGTGFQCFVRQMLGINPRAWREGVLPLPPPHLALLAIALQFGPAVVFLVGMVRWLEPDFSGAASVLALAAIATVGLGAIVVLLRPTYQPYRQDQPGSDSAL